MNPLSRLTAHADLLWRDHKGHYDQQLAAKCHRLLANTTPLSGIWIDALRTARKLDTDAGSWLERATDQSLGTRSGNRLAFLLGYLLEIGRQDQAISLFDRHRHRLSALIDQNPALCWLANHTLPPEAQPPLAHLFGQAGTTRQAFEEWVADNNHRITLIGNGPIEQQPVLADDPKHLVVDFNQPCHNISPPPQCRHAWVRTPNTSVPPRPDQDLDWVVFSGNNSLYQRIRFRPLLAVDFSPDKYLFVPSRIWLELIGVLEAPPSAGLIMLHWIASLRGGLEGVDLQGFSIQPGAHPLNDRPGRHRWDRERAFLQRWWRP